MSAIKEATYNDIEKLTTLGLEFFGQRLSDTGLECDYASIYDFVFELIDNRNSVIFVYRNNGDILGYIAGTVEPWTFNRNISMLYEKAWYVPERFRDNSTIGGRLFMALKKWGKEMGATVFVISSNIREESERVCAFYERIGVRLTDKTYIGRL